RPTTPRMARRPRSGTTRRSVARLWSSAWPTGPGDRWIEQEVTRMLQAGARFLLSVLLLATVFGAWLQLQGAEDAGAQTDRPAPAELVAQAGCPVTTSQPLAATTTATAPTGTGTATGTAPTTTVTATTTATLTPTGSPALPLTSPSPE